MLTRALRLWRTPTGGRNGPSASDQPPINFADRLQDHRIVKLANGWINSPRASDSLCPASPKSATELLAIPNTTFQHDERRVETHADGKSVAEAGGRVNMA